MISILGSNVYSENVDSKWWFLGNNKEHPIFHVGVSSYTYYKVVDKDNPKEIMTYWGTDTTYPMKVLDTPETTVSLVAGLAFFGYDNWSFNQNIHLINDCYNDLDSALATSISINYTSEQLSLYHMNIGIFTETPYLNDSGAWGIMIGEAF